MFLSLGDFDAGLGVAAIEEPLGLCPVGNTGLFRFMGGGFEFGTDVLAFGLESAIFLQIGL